MKFLLAAAIAASTAMSPAAAAISLISGSGNPAAVVSGGTSTGFEDVGTGDYAELMTAGMSFTAEPGTMFSISSDYAGQFNNSGQSLQGSFGSSAFQSLTIAFATSVQAVAFNYGGADTNWLLQAFDSSGQSLGTVTLLPTHATNTGTYYGIASTGQDIASALLSVDLPNYDPSTLHPDYIFLDNVTAGQFVSTAPVPELSEWAMMTLGLGLVGTVVRRRRAA